MGRTFLFNDFILKLAIIRLLDDFLQSTFIIHHMRKSTDTDFRENDFFKKRNDRLHPLIYVQRADKCFKYVCK